MKTADRWWSRRYPLLTPESARTKPTTAEARAAIDAKLRDVWTFGYRSVAGWLEQIADGYNTEPGPDGDVVFVTIDKIMAGPEGWTPILRTALEAEVRAGRMGRVEGGADDKPGCHGYYQIAAETP